MGLIRKAMSVSTMGLVDFQSDKERAARSARLTKQAVRKSNRIQKEQNELIAEQNKMLAQSPQQPPAQQMPAPAGPPAGWYPDPRANAVPDAGLRYWDGFQWTDQVQARND